MLSNAVAATADDANAVTADGFCERILHLRPHLSFSHIYISLTAHRNSREDATKHHLHLFLFFFLLSGVCDHASKLRRVW
jgi:hypothetical protein